MTGPRFTVFVAALLSVVAAPLCAQGNVSTQGYGFPQGQLTTRSLAVGGSIGEIDPSSPLNPAAMGRLTTRTVLFQIEPEYRLVTTSGVAEHTTTARYPMVFVGVPFGTQWVTSVSSASLLDRSWQTSTSQVETIGSEQVATTQHESSNGAINDLQLAEAWSNRDWFYVGVGLHGYTGRNVVSSGQDFAANADFSSFSTDRTISYSGTALSAGVELIALQQATLGVSYRKGGGMKARSGDSTIAQGNVPDHLGISAAYLGIRGTILSVRAAHDLWSSMTPMLATPGAAAHDAWDFSGGAEVAGPRIGGQAIWLRAGARTRTLPFEAAGNTVTEKSFSFGSGISFGGGRMTSDATIVRQFRDAGLANVQEHAWTLSVSITARP